MRVKIKICGLTTLEAVQAVADAGVDAAGFVFAESPRQVDVETATRLAKELPPFVTRVAVFRYPDPATVAEVVAGFRPDVVQTEPVPNLEHARLLPVYHDGPGVLDAVAAAEPQALLLEAAGRGGRGVAPDWGLASELARRTRLVLAGGLNANNVREAIRSVRPWAVDVSSGVESKPGHKDRQRILAFVAAVRREDLS